MTAPENVFVIVRGAPGVGKSSAVRLVKRHLPNGAIVEVDAVRGMLTGVRWQDGGQHRFALDRTALLARSFFEGGLAPIIIIDTFNRGLVTDFVKALPAQATQVVTLWAEPEILRTRVEQRPLDDFRDLEACLKINAEVLRTPHPSEVVIDSSALRVEDVAGRILSLIAVKA